MRRYQKMQSFMFTKSTPVEAGESVGKRLSGLSDVDLKELISTEYEAGENMIHLNEDNFITIEDCGCGYISVELYSYVGEA